MFIKTKSQKGFTLVEMIVSISIMSLIVTIVLFNYSSSGDNLATSSAGQEVAITIRQAQTYGLAVRPTSSGVFLYAYGVHFNPTSNPTGYYLFADKDDDGVYDAGTGSCGSATTECVQAFTFRNGITATGVCSISTCYSSGTRSINFTFLRPSPDAAIYVTGGGLNSTPGKGSVILTSPKGKTVTITVENTGQILIQ